MAEFRPQPGPQTAFLTSPADIAIFGGAAGGGKSYAILLEAMRYKDVPGFGAVVFRRTLADVKKEGSLWDTSLLIYGQAGGKPRLDTLSWSFPRKTKVTFSHLEHEKNVLDWQGAQIPLIIFDELTHFSRAQFFYMLSRNRSTCGVKPYIRATTNPDSDSWVADFISWWIDQDTGFAIPERSGVLRWFARVGDAIRWADTREELAIEYPDCEPKSVTFIASRLEDNKILMEADPGYRANLLAMDRVERERLLNGNWKIRPSSGLYFQRHWCEIVDNVPLGTRFVRGWDIAATPKTEMNDPDWTTGTKIGRCPDGRYIVADHRYLQGAPLRVEQAVLQTAIEDGEEVRIHMPQDPAAAGKAQAEVFRQLLAGFNVRFAVATGDKVTRFAGFSAQADPGPSASTGGKGKVLVLRGPWNERWFSQLEGFPDAVHDDDADSTAEAFNGLVGKYGPGEALLEAVKVATRKAAEAAAKDKDKPKLVTYAPGCVEYDLIMESAE
ncbi:MAG TPA: phage terminase large subunit [Roseiarcus sp.]|nr:phage terminase large subunit [Roseiarcus sp.]